MDGGSGGAAPGATPSSQPGAVVQNAPGQLPGTTPSSTPTPGIGQRSGTKNLFAGAPVAGRGLPGMPGGPPVNEPMGARDPSSIFMQPRNIGSLACDMAVSPECLLLF